MQITIHGRRTEVSPDLRNYATQKLELLSKYLSTVETVDVELYEEGKGGAAHVAHVRVATSGPVFRSKVVGKDHKICIDVAAARLERRLKEFKRKRSGKPAHARTKVNSGPTSQEGIGSA